jgi:hypothetical protein
MQWVTAVAICAAFAVPAQAQRRPAARAAAAADGQPGLIRIGQTVTGTLTASSPKMTERGRFRVYRFNGQSGQRVIITLRSGDFDAYLTLARTVSGITDAIATDDDRGGGEKNTDSRVRATLPVTGTYLVVAQSLSEDGVGAYSLSVEQAPAATTAVSRPIALGQTVSGRLDETDAVLESDETFYDTWTLTGRKGQRIQIDMRSDSLDSFLSFGRMENGEFSSLKTDDDGGGELHSKLVITLPDDGQYVIRANEVGAKTGAYTLAVTERQPGPTTATPHPIEPNTEVTGTLNEEDPSAEDESYYDYWTYEGHAGERVTITMSSEAFDTYLSIGTLDGTTFSELASDDDGAGEGTNSKLEFTLPNNGTYVIRAKALSGENEGSYTLKVTPQH